MQGTEEVLRDILHSKNTIDYVVQAFFSKKFAPVLGGITKRAMGYKVKIQRVDRKSTCSYYVNFPVAVAEVINLDKAEEWEWLLEDKNTLVFKRLKSRKMHNTQASSSCLS